LEKRNDLCLLGAGAVAGLSLSSTSGPLILAAPVHTRGLHVGGRDSLARGFGLLGSVRIVAGLIDGDRLEATLGDAQRHRPLVVPAPDRQIAAGADLFDEAEADQLGCELLRGSALEVGRQNDAAVLTL